MNEIIFKSNNLLGFYYLWASSFNNTKLLDKTLVGFDDVLTKIKDAVPSSFIKETFDALKKLDADIRAEKIKTIDDFVSFLGEKMPKDGHKLNQPLRLAYASYESFMSKKEIQQETDKVIGALTQFKENYDERIKQLYTFFDVSKDVKLPFVQVSSYPETIPNSGSASDSGINVNFSLKRDDNEDYLGNSLFLKRRTTTPLHEATHFLFSKSPMYKNSPPYMKKLLALLEQKLEESPEGSNKTAMRALDEGVAACSSALIEKKINGNLDNKAEWYAGFKLANHLAPKIFPVFQRYLSESKKLDDEFFKVVYESMTNNKFQNLESKLIQDKMDETKNIPPLIYKNSGKSV